MNQQRKTIYALRRQILEGRYVPEPTGRGQEEGQDRRRRRRADRVRQRHTVDELAKRRAADAGAHVRRADRGAAPTDAERRTDAGGRCSSIRRGCARSIYRQFGALPRHSAAWSRTAPRRSTGWPTRSASSMIQQRERLLDLVRGDAADGARPALPAQRPRRGLGPRRADRGDQGALRLRARASTQRKALEREALEEKLWAEMEKVIEARESEFSLPHLLYFARHFYLEEIDARWIEHLKAMEALREGIGLRGYGQKDPKQEYKKEGFVDLRRDDGGASAERLREAVPRADPARAKRRRRARRQHRAGAAARAPHGRVGRRRRSRAPASGDGQRRARRRQARAPRSAQGRPQRSLSLRKRQEIQEMPRRRRDGLISLGAAVAALAVLRLPARTRRRRLPGRARDRAARLDAAVVAVQRARSIVSGTASC